MILLPGQGENDLGVGWTNISNNISMHNDRLSHARPDSKCFMGISSFNPNKTPLISAVITSFSDKKTQTQRGQLMSPESQTGWEA